MNISTFHTDLRESMSARGINTHRLSILAKVDSASLYNFLKGTASLSGENLLKLNPFIYKAPEKTSHAAPQMTSQPPPPRHPETPGRTLNLPHRRRRMPDALLNFGVALVVLVLCIVGFRRW